ncbi:MAG TPA: hypothetical protein VHJ78_06660 [Actinomycetota bacterium]|nr:hypothetical protein [Actinomycetota bacterium]
MIIRILGVGQYEVPDEAVSELNALDDALTGPIEQHDDQALHSGLQKILDAVQRLGSRVPDDFLGPSDLLMPGPDSTVDDIRELLTEEGLIPD